MTASPAAASERDAVVALWGVAGLIRPWNDAAADFDLALGAPASTVLLAREGPAVLGSVMVGFDGHRGWVYYLAVDPARRGEGVGRALMEAAEAWLRSRGCPKIQLMVRTDNAAAQGFYAASAMNLKRLRPWDAGWTGRMRRDGLVSADGYGHVGQCRCGAFGECPIGLIGFSGLDLNLG